MPITSTSVPLGYHSTGIAGQTASLTAPQKWEIAGMVGLQEEDSFRHLEGSDPDRAFVWTVRDSGAGSGHIIHFRNKSGFYGEGKRGATTFSVNADFEQRKFGQFGALIGVHRHASSEMEAVNLEYALDMEVKDGTAVEEGRWMGRRLFENAAMTIRERSPSSGRYFAGGRTLETLRSTDIFDRNQLIIANGLLKNIGGGCANVSREGAQVLMRTMALAPSLALTRLKLDPAYQKMVEAAGARGSSNPVFNGTVVDLDDTLIREHHSFFHSGDGPQGSVFNPVGKLYGQGTDADIVAGTGVFDMTFGENSDDIFYTKWFPGYNYVYNEYGAGSSDTLGSPHTTAFPTGTNASLPAYIHGSAGTTGNIDTGGEHYLMVINPPQAKLLRDATYSVPNGVGFYSYITGNDGKKITITGRLGSATGGQGAGTAAGTHYRGRVTQLPQSINLAAAGTVINGGASATTINALGYNAGVGIVTWGAGTYGGVTLTDSHPKGSTVLPCNAKGVPFGYVPILGGGALCRAIGHHRLRRGGKGEEDEFIKKMFTRGYMGHRCCVDRAGNPKLVLLTCALSDPSLPLPVVAA